MKQTEMVRQSGGGTKRLSDANGGGRKLDIPKHDPDATASDPEILDSVEARLAALRGERTPGRNPAADSDHDDDPNLEDIEDDERDADDEDDLQADDSTDDDSPTLESDEVDDKADNDVPALPEAFVRCALACGWENREKVIDFYKQDPTTAISMFSSLYATRNKASAEFAALGRQRIADRKAQQAGDTQESTEKVPQVDTEALREKYGDDAGPLIGIIEQQNSAIARLERIIPQSSQPAVQPVTQTHTPSQRADEALVQQQLEDFFDGADMEPYAKIYGKLEMGQTWDDLAPGQRLYRWKVMEEADAIAGGINALQGGDITLKEALERAHSVVTRRFRDKIIVDGIKAKVTRRNKGLTLDPAKGRRRRGALSDDDVSKPRTKEQVESAVQKRMDKAFSGR